MLKAAIGVLGALYFTNLIMVHTMISADFAMVLVPGWRDAIFPPFQALHGLQGAVATTIIAMFLMRNFSGLREYVSVDFFWGASKILLGLSLLWAYFFFTEFIIFWYGRQPVEQAVLKTFMFNSYRWPFIAAVFLCWLIPFLTLIWNFARKSMVFPHHCRIVGGAWRARGQDTDLPRAPSPLPTNIALRCSGTPHPERLSEGPSGAVALRPRRADADRDHCGRGAPLFAGDQSRADAVYLGGLRRHALPEAETVP